MRTLVEGLSPTELQECGNCQYILDMTARVFELILTKMSLKDVVRLSTLTPFGVRIISEYTFPQVLRVGRDEIAIRKS